MTKSVLREPDANIHTWPEQDRPAHKLRYKGADALSDTEVLSILLRNGHGEVNAVEVARKVIAVAGSLTAALNATVDLCAEAGLTGEQCTRLQAALEIARRSKSHGARYGKNSRPAMRSILPLPCVNTYDYPYNPCRTRFSCASSWTLRTALLPPKNCFAAR